MPHSVVRLLCSAPGNAATTRVGCPSSLHGSKARSHPYAKGVVREGSVRMSREMMTRWICRGRTGEGMHRGGEKAVTHEVVVLCGAGQPIES